MSAALMMDVDRRGVTCPIGCRSVVSPVRALVLLAVAVGLCVPAVAGAQSGQHVAVVINESSPDSAQVGEHYVRQRGVPPANVIRIRTAPEEVIERSTFRRDIEQPIIEALSRGRLQDQILYIVLTKGIPLRIAGTAGRDGTTASVDSEVTLVYRRMVGETILTRGSVPNPYHLANGNVGDAKRFTHRDHDIYLVTRLDAFTAPEAMALVDRCTAPSSAGYVVLDQRGVVTNRLGDEWLAAAARTLVSHGHSDRVLLDTQPKVTAEMPLIGYYSWGSADPDNRSRMLGMTFVPGSVAASFVSTDARTFEEPDASWTPGDSATKSTWFAGSSQSLIGDLIRQGVSGAAGHVSEPYLHSAVRPESLFLAYLSGFNLAESYYLAMPHLSWQTVVVGDPLCRVADRPPLTSVDLDPGWDADAEASAWFAARQRKQAVRGAGAAPERAVRLMIRADNLTLQGNLKAAQRALSDAIDAAPRMVEAQVRLAELYARMGEFEAAIEHYEKALALAPDHLLTLNNLAYALAVHRNMPSAALPLAEKAVALARSDGRVLDTLAWIEHLMGRHTAAATHISEALRRNADEPIIRLHAAFIYEAVNAQGPGRRALDEALRLNPDFAAREDVQRLDARLRDRLLAAASADTTD